MSRREARGDLFDICPLPKLHKIITRAYREVLAKVNSEGITHRNAAFELGVARVARAVELRGFV